MVPLAQLAEHSFYIDYSIPLKNSLTEETDLKHGIQNKVSLCSKKSPCTMGKIQKLSLTLRTLLLMLKVDTSNNDVNLDDFDELRDSIHLSKQRIPSRHLGPGFSSKKDSKESESYPLQSYLETNATTSIKNEITKNKLRDPYLLKGKSSIEQKVCELRAKAA
jgi:hypothetical protein